MIPPPAAEHGIGEEGAVDVLDKPGEDRPGREGSRVVLGQTGGGRYLRLIYVPDPEPNSVFVVTQASQKGSMYETK